MTDELHWSVKRKCGRRRIPLCNRSDSELCRLNRQAEAAAEANLQWGDSAPGGSPVCPAQALLLACQRLAPRARSEPLPRRAGMRRSGHSPLTCLG